MLENVNLERKLPKGEYHQALPALQRRLYDLEKACWDEGIPSVVIFEGWDASGKGGSISALTQRLDPRGFKLYAVTDPRTHDLNYPWLRRFWLRVPNRGEMVILDHSWYRRVLDERVDKIVSAAECRKAFTDIVEFERMLSADGCVFVKLWFHISRDEQKKRFRAIEHDPLEAWRVTELDWKRHQQYDAYMDAAEQMLELTESGFAPWTIIEATSKYFARKKVFEVIISALERALGEKAPPVRVERRRPRRAVRVAVTAPAPIAAVSEPAKAGKAKKDRKSKQSKASTDGKTGKKKPKSKKSKSKKVRPETAAPKKPGQKTAKTGAPQGGRKKQQAARSKPVLKKRAKPATAGVKGGESNA